MFTAKSGKSANPADKTTAWLDLQRILSRWAGGISPGNQDRCQTARLHAQPSKTMGLTLRFERSTLKGVSMPFPHTITEIERDRSHVANGKGGKRESFRQAVELRELTYSIALQLRDTDSDEEANSIARAKCQAVAAACRAWEAIDERLRIIRGDPLPGSLKPTSDRKPKRSTSSPRPVAVARAEVSTPPTVQTPEVPRP